MKQTTLTYAYRKLPPTYPHAVQHDIVVDRFAPELIRNFKVRAALPRIFIAAATRMAHAGESIQWRYPRRSRYGVSLWHCGTLPVAALLGAHRAF